METEQKKSGWKIWVYLTPVYIILAIPLVKWTMRINSGDVDLSKDEYSAFNAQDGEVKKADTADYDPGLRDVGYTVRYRSGDDQEESPAPQAGERQPQARPAGQQPQQQARAQAQAQPQPRQQPQQQAAQAGTPEQNKTNQSYGSRKGYLTLAVGKLMNNPKAVKAMMNNDWIVKGFMARSTVKDATASPQALKNYLQTSPTVTAFLSNGIVQAAMNNPEIATAFASSEMASALLSTPGVQGLLEDPEAVQSLVNNNPQAMQLLTNPNVMNALASNPKTAGLLGGMGGDQR